MSNLKLPSMTYDSLAEKLRGASERTIAYKTKAIQYDVDGLSIGVTHHDHLIAIVHPNGVQLVHAGWNSVTTSARMNRVLCDNLPGTEYRVGIRQGILSLIHHYEVRPLSRTHRETFLNY